MSIEGIPQILPFPFKDWKRENYGDDRIIEARGLLPYHRRRFTPMILLR